MTDGGGNRTVPMMCGGYTNVIADGRMMKNKEKIAKNVFKFFLKNKIDIDYSVVYNSFNDRFRI